MHAANRHVLADFCDGVVCHECVEHALPPSCSGAFSASSRKRRLRRRAQPKPFSGQSAFYHKVGFGMFYSRQQHRDRLVIPNGNEAFGCGTYPISWTGVSRRSLVRSINVRFHGRPSVQQRLFFASIMPHQLCRASSWTWDAL